MPPPGNVPRSLKGFEVQKLLRNKFLIIVHIEHYSFPMRGTWVLIGNLIFLVLFPAVLVAAWGTAFILGLLWTVFSPSFKK